MRDVPRKQFGGFSTTGCVDGYVATIVCGISSKDGGLILQARFVGWKSNHTSMERLQELTANAAPISKPSPVLDNIRAIADMIAPDIYDVLVRYAERGYEGVSVRFTPSYSIPKTLFRIEFKLGECLLFQYETLYSYATIFEEIENALIRKYHLKILTPDSVLVTRIIYIHWEKAEQEASNCGVA